MAAQHPLRGIQKIKNLIAVANGKGVVGKTTVAINIALALSRQQTFLPNLVTPAPSDFRCRDQADLDERLMNSRNCSGPDLYRNIVNAYYRPTETLTHTI